MIIAMKACPSIDLVRTGKRIEAIRKSRGFSVRDIQEYFGFEYPQAVYKWQHGECLPSVDNLLALARLFRVGMEDLLVVSGSEDQEVPLFLSASLLSALPAPFISEKIRQTIGLLRPGDLPVSVFSGYISSYPAHCGSRG